MDKIGPYEIQGVLGRGGMSVVYRAHDPRHDRDVALKLPRGRQVVYSDDQLFRFAREVRALKRLEHPAIVPIYETGSDEGRPYLALRLIEGESLGDYVERLGPVEPDLAVRIVGRLTLAMVHAHARWVLHRDIKPDNVLIDRSGCPFLTDFGLVKLLDDGPQEICTAPDTAVGTVGYISPEVMCQGSGVASVQSDVFGLGAVLYFLLTGRSPFRGLTAREVLARTLAGRFTLPSLIRSDVGSDLDAVCAKALAAQPKDRYESAVALAQDLGRLLVQEKPLAPAPRRDPAEAIDALLSYSFEDEDRPSTLSKVWRGSSSSLVA